MKEYDKINALNQVAEFHKTFHHPVMESPGIPSESRCKLRLSLIAEELKELEEAIQNRDIVQIADALSDIQYVLSGAVLEFGLAEKFVELFNEVHRSNMSKACKTEEDAKTTLAWYKDNTDTDCYFKKSDGSFLVYRTSDNKTLKSVNYSSADLKSILDL
jgi:predicted HAD superfamily Cof-like phosphohydrolase